MNRLDAIIVGSGPGGVLSALLLANQGLKILVLEKGGEYKLTSCPPSLKRKCYRNISTVAYL
ncbi:FAD-dependent monooxygenase [Vibrio algarum]|uniref:FAD-dependent monooxygenase n=1 Tax=Vibrio algarum TaxID=3020714 RepID=UPI00389A0C41